MQNSKIEWTHHTQNLWWGCTKVNAGCDNCYAERLDNRYHHKAPHWGNDATRLFVNSYLKNFFRFQKLAKQANEIHRVFVGSMMDIFEKPMPTNIAFINDTEAIREEYFNEIIPLTPNLMHLLLTKRPGNINKYIPDSWKKDPPKNVMFGTSVVDQATADKLIPQLLQVNGKRFLSMEPLLNGVDLSGLIWVKCPRCEGSQSLPVVENGEVVGGSACPKCLIPYQGVISGIDWVIVGGESGPNKRPFNPNWARSLRDECRRGRIPFFMKQIDKIQHIPDDLMIREFPKY